MQIKRGWGRMITVWQVQRIREGGSLILQESSDHPGAVNRAFGWLNRRGRFARVMPLSMYEGCPELVGNKVGWYREFRLAPTWGGSFYFS